MKVSIFFRAYLLIFELFYGILYENIILIYQSIFIKDSYLTVVTDINLNSRILLKHLLLYDKKDNCKGYPVFNSIVPSINGFILQGRKLSTLMTFLFISVAGIIIEAPALTTQLVKVSGTISGFYGSVFTMDKHQAIIRHYF